MFPSLSLYPFAYLQVCSLYIFSESWSWMFKM